MYLDYNKILPWLSSDYSKLRTAFLMETIIRAKLLIVTAMSVFQ